MGEAWEAGCRPPRARADAGDEGFGEGGDRMGRTDRTPRNAWSTLCGRGAGGGGVTWPGRADTQRKVGRGDVAFLRWDARIWARVRSWTTGETPIDDARPGLGDWKSAEHLVGETVTLLLPDT